MDEALRRKTVNELFYKRQFEETLSLLTDEDVGIKKAAQQALANKKRTETAESCIRRYYNVFAVFVRCGKEWELIDSDSNLDIMRNGYGSAKDLHHLDMITDSQAASHKGRFIFRVE